jgi:cell division protein ZapE
MWGGVGRGKSMLMDLFHECLRISGKRRVHFHAFMLEVHARLREERKKEPGDPIPPVAAAIAATCGCLAFDEMVVNNSADAMIMSRLFTALIVDHGRGHRHHLEPRPPISTRTASTASTSCPSSP